jgi:subtilisin family serine protease
VGQQSARLPTITSYFNAGTSGVDLKLATAFDHYSGKGVKVYVTDDGLNHTHQDIAANYISGYDFCTGGGAPTPKGNHGTMVTGLIAAVGKNGEGVAGVGYESKVFVNNLISNCQSGGDKFVDAILTQVKTYHAWSGSFGTSAQYGFPNSLE